MHRLFLDTFSVPENSFPYSVSYMMWLHVWLDCSYTVLSYRDWFPYGISTFAEWATFLSGLSDAYRLSDVSISLLFYLCSCALGVRSPFVRCAFLCHPMLHSLRLPALPCNVIAANGFDYWCGSSAESPHRSLVEHSGSPKSPCSLQVPVFVCILRFESATSRAGGNADNSLFACGCPVPWNRGVPPTDSS